MVREKKKEIEKLMTDTLNLRRQYQKEHKLHHQEDLNHQLQIHHINQLLISKYIN